MCFNPFLRLIWLAGAVLYCVQTVALADPITVTVRADRFFNATGILASGGDVFHIEATGIVDISTLNGGYRTDPNGTIVETPPHDSGAFEFFRDRALPIGVEPVAGTGKIFSPIASFLPGHLDGAPYGALVVGFSLSPNPTSFADFPNGLQSHGFILVGASRTITAPSTGGYLFLGVNDFNNPGGDNAGSFSTLVIQVVPEPGTLTLLGIGTLGLFTYNCCRRSWRSRAALTLLGTPLVTKRKCREPYSTEKPMLRGSLHDSQKTPKR